MCSIANPFNTNMRKFDAEKRNFLFCLECLNCKSLGKIIFLNKSKISVLEVEL